MSAMESRIAIQGKENVDEKSFYLGPKLFLFVVHNEPIEHHVRVVISQNVSFYTICLKGYFHN